MRLKVRRIKISKGSVRLRLEERVDGFAVMSDSAEGTRQIGKTQPGRFEGELFLQASREHLEELERDGVAAPRIRKRR